MDNESQKSEVKLKKQKRAVAVGFYFFNLTSYFLLHPLQMSVIQPRVVFESNLVIDGMGAKYPLEVPHHRRVAGMTLERRVRRRQQSSGRAFVVKLLAQAEDAFLAQRGRKEFLDQGGRAFVAHFLIVGAVGQQQLFIVTEERRGCGAALIPDQHAPSLGPQNAGKFGASARQVEPMRRLGGGNKINGGGAQRRLLGCSSNGHQSIVGFELMD